MLQANEKNKHEDQSAGEKFDLLVNKYEQPNAFALYL